MGKKELQVKKMFSEMLKDMEKYAEIDEDYQEDMEYFNVKIQWEVGSIKGYQVFDGGKYSFKVDGEIEDPDVTLKLKDFSVAKQLISGESEDFILNNLGKDFEIIAGSFPLMKLSKIPLFKPVFEKFIDTKNSTGTTIPINKSLGTFENQVLPLAVVEYFIKKGSYIFLMNNCRCRIINNCKDHDKSIACTWIGRGVMKINVPSEIGHLATKEEALERSRLAYNNGLVPTIGRLRGDSIMMGALPDTGHFMSLCYCCPCCCILGTWKEAAKSVRNIFQRMEGVSVNVDREICDGCGLCTEVCIFNGMQIVDGKSVIAQDKCLGCGRCERVCPNEAISITIDDFKGFDTMIARIESHVDVT
jgi:UDP-glucose 4-epimerase